MVVFCSFAFPLVQLLSHFVAIDLVRFLFFHRVLAFVLGLYSL